MNARLIQCILILLICAGGLNAQTRSASISGYVSDSSSGETLPNANVQVDSIRVGTTTDKAGYFVIGNLFPGDYSVTVSYIGYEKKVLAITVEPGQSTRYSVELEPILIEGDVIESVGERVSTTDVTPVGSFGIRVTELARIPTVGTADLMRGIQLLPGVQAASDNSAGLYVRGGTPGQNLILLDDVVVYNPNHLFGFFSTFNPDALKDVLLLKGTFPARYGDRLSSVLDITNLDGNRKSFKSRVSLDLISAGATAEGPVGERGSWMISGRRTYQELLNSPLFSHLVDEMFSTRTGTITAAPAAGGGGPGGGGPGQGGGRFRPGGGGGLNGGRFGQGRINFNQATSDFDQGYHFYDSNFKMNLDPSDTDKISLSGYLGKDQLDLTLPSFRNTERSQLMDWGNQIGRLRWLHLYSDNLLGTVQVSASRYVSNFEVATTQNENQGGRPGFGLDRNNSIVDLTFKTDFDYYTSPNHKSKVGFQLSQYDAVYKQGRQDSVRSAINTVSIYSTGYLEHSWRIGGLELAPGLRVSYFGSGNYTDYSPRVSGLFQTNDKVAFKAGWGMYHQYINLISVEGFSFTTDMWLPVDETLDPGQAEHRAFGFIVTPREGWEVDMEFYHKDMKNLVEFQSQVRLDGTTPLSDLFLQGDGTSYGGEFLLRKTEGRTTGWIGYTLSKTENEFPDLNDGKPFPPKYDRRHDMSVVLDHFVGRGWNANLTWVYGTGQAYTIPESRYTVIQLSGQPISFVHVSDKNAFRLPPYHRLDLGLTRNFNWGAVNGDITVSVFNVYNRRNIWYRSFDVTDDVIEFQDVMLQPILPSIGFKFKL